MHDFLMFISGCCFTVLMFAAKILWDVWTKKNVVARETLDAARHKLLAQLRAAESAQDKDALVRAVDDLDATLELFLSDLNSALGDTCLPRLCGRSVAALRDMLVTAKAKGQWDTNHSQQVRNLIYALEGEF